MLAAWFLVMPPRTTNDDCTITYYEDTPVAEWAATIGPLETLEECETVRHDVANRLERRRRGETPLRPVRRGPLDAILRLFFPPHTFMECEAVADYWALEHTRCAER
jgi:hypothetical protein